jgi:hypothetical protein
MSPSLEASGCGMKAGCVCGRPVDGAFLCRSCSERLQRALGDLPALIADLDVTLTRQAVTGAHGEGKPTKKDAQPSPVHIGAAEVASNLRYVLATSVRYLTEARGIVAVPADNPLAMARWLLLHHDSIRLDPAGPDIASDIHGVTRAIWKVIDPDPLVRIRVGRCPEPVEVVNTPDGRIVIQAYCPGEVWVFIPSEESGEPAIMECRCCRHVWPAIQWGNAGKRILKRGAA